MAAMGGSDIDPFLGGVVNEVVAVWAVDEGDGGFVPAVSVLEVADVGDVDDIFAGFFDGDSLPAERASDAGFEARVRHR